MARTTSDDRERGSMHVMTIPIAVGLLSAAVLVIAMVGSATNDRREAGTAADAAALAATQEWDRNLGLLHGLHLGVSEPEGFWGLAEGAVLGLELEDDMREAARTFAERNGAELVGFYPDPENLRVTVEVEHDELIPGTEVRSTASATASITLRGGLCVGEDGLGWLIDGLCATEPEPDEEGSEDGSQDGGLDEGDGEGDGEGGAEGDDSEDGDPEGGDPKDGDSEGDLEPEPEWTPPEVDPYSSTVVLTD
ncbi:putative Flp pilus-assembly TadE/G-like [Promicromonospora umidemergens]|uniref:Putative Flp pilus-assembly TadG-like N-terminal domain-containing protein n=1 Tax=Promicromonospora umidemergens TaxID=629679 RepID=A0ABP8XDQ2_9MICO|nr:pilus assembly protein TadG-related protein [Promicromonospora umidemergens]MCP2283113.1 putative Flp pilus-assembly TadE/G-like [Promicromonospora umidemergens]